MPIQATERGWALVTRSAAYALGLNDAGRLTHRYWGPRLPAPDDYPHATSPAGWASFTGPAHLTPEEYPGYGGPSYVEPCLKLTFADGTRDLALRFAGAEAREGEAPELLVTLRDAAYPLRVTLRYRLHEPYDLLERSATIANEGEAPVSIERALSALWHLPRGEGYRLSHLTGRWLDEFHLKREPLTQGVKVLESRRITTSHHHSPWFAVDAGGADEDQGAVWFGTLAWSGSWKMLAETTDFLSTRVGIGVNDWDFAWRLGPGETFETPACVGGFTAGGFGAASRALHDYARERVLPDGAATRMVLYNSWEATTFSVDEESQAALAERAAALGVELFVMDDGWFHRRDSDNAGLGDWWPDARKFPRGLGPLVARVNALGMAFGLWVEPEMVNPDSDLYRAHPEWAIHFPSRERTPMRNQLILNLARDDVQDYLIDVLDRLLAENDIRFIKWDMNRNVSEPGWPGAEEPRELWVRYVQGLYRVWGTLRERHPRVVWQTCSGGGGRVDLGILQLASQAWVSDNTDPPARLGIQHGYSQVFPAATMEAWVTESGAAYLPLAFRFHVSMCGALGVGSNLLRWGEEEHAEAARWIALYKQIRHIVHGGAMYRLRSPAEHPFSAVQYVAKDRSEGVLFAFRTHIPSPAQLPPVSLRGLDPEVRYEVEGLSGARSGAAWMHAGLSIELGDFESTVRRIRRVA